MRLQGEEKEEKPGLEKRKRGPGEGGGGGGQGGDPNPKRKRLGKPYRRHPKPPFSYLALIALVIQAAPQKRLKLSQILSEIERLFPLFSGGYQGWKDSIRHNLSSNSCFFKEESGNKKGKRNFWRVDVSRIPAGLLKRQNMVRGQERGPSFVPDLAPFVLQGETYPPASQEDPSPNRTPPKKDLPSSRGASFRIEELVPEATTKTSLDPAQEEATPPFLYAPHLPPSCYWHWQTGVPSHYWVGMETPFSLPNSFYPFPLPSPSSTCSSIPCLNPTCSLLAASPSFALHQGHPISTEVGHGLHSTSMDPQLCCLSYPPVPGWPPY